MKKSRRWFLGSSGAACLSGCSPLRKRPARSGPNATHGVQIGDIDRDRAVLWSRSERPATLCVDWSTRVHGPKTRLEGVPTPNSDGVVKLELEGLPPGQTVFYRAWFDDGVKGEPVTGTFTVPDPAQPVRLVWGGDVCGQGYGIGPDGYRIFEAMAKQTPHAFIHSGDAIYADQPLVSEKDTGHSGVWKNLELDGKEKVAETLDEFRAQFAYNLRDRHLRHFLSRTPIIAQWDDHETHNNWWPGQTLTDERYQERSVDVLSAHARRAFHEYMPTRERFMRVLRLGAVDVFVLDLRSHRGSNDANQSLDGSVLFGARQLAWLERALAES
ncbi:MAG: alkaline phosphatase D family protein, partial [Myxococcota bacterium]